MARWYARDDDALINGGGLAMLAVGLLAGLAAGAYMADRLGGMSGISDRIRRRLRSRMRARRANADLAGDYEAGGEVKEEGHAGSAYHDGYDDAYDDTFDDTYDDVDEDAGEATPEGAAGAWAQAAGEDDLDAYEEDEDEETDDDADEFASADPELEDRVLEAFVNDPVLRERAVDIGAINPGTIELSGAVLTAEEYERATILARGVPGVATVVNRLVVQDAETTEERAAARYTAGDPRATEARWESDIIGTGRPRQGTSQDVGRHADPKVPLEERATREAEALRQAADDPGDTAARRRRRPERGERSDGSSVAPSGVPKADHVIQDPPPG